jgi:hypothetical protein
MRAPCSPPTRRAASGAHWAFASTLAVALAAGLASALVAPARGADPPAASAAPTASAVPPSSPTSPASAAAPANDAAATTSQAQRARLERVRTLRRERPGDGLLVFYEALTLAVLGERDAALTTLRTLDGRRLGLVPIRGIGFDPLWDDPEFKALRGRLADAEPRTPDAPVAFRLDDAGLVPEGIAWDAAGRRHFVGSIAKRKIVVREASGAVHDWSRPEDRLEAVLGLAVDARRHALWAVTTNGFEDAARRERRNAVVRYDLATGRLAARHDVPDAMQLNDVAVGPDGALYTTDSAAGSLFRMRSGDAGFTRIGAAGALPGANGVAVAPDGTVYVAIATGIGRLDPANDTLQRLPQPDDVASGAIDGLYWHEGDLVGIQNVTNPGRVVRLPLGDEGRRIDGLTVLQSHHHAAFTEPTTGTIVGGVLHVLANTYVGHYQPDGTIEDAAALAPTVVLAVPLRR